MAKPFFSFSLSMNRRCTVCTRSLDLVYLACYYINWVKPSWTYRRWPMLRLTMIVGATTYALFIAQLLILNTILLYAASALLGVGAAIIWTAQESSLSIIISDFQSKCQNVSISHRKVYNCIWKKKILNS